MVALHLHDGQHGNSLPVSWMWRLKCEGIINRGLTEKYLNRVELGWWHREDLNDSSMSKSQMSLMVGETALFCLMKFLLSFVGNNFTKMSRFRIRSSFFFCFFFWIVDCKIKYSKNVPQIQNLMDRYDIQISSYHLTIYASIIVNIIRTVICGNKY